MATQKASARAEAYRLLSGLFCDPDRAALLAENVPSRLERCLETLGSASVASAQDLSGELASVDGEALRIDHARLFVGPGELPSPPYGSVYLEEGRQVCGASTRAVSEAYEEAGLLLEEAQHELPDHIAAELEFMHVLAWREHEAWGRGDAEEAGREAGASRSFLEEHLGRWARRFAADVRRAAEQPFYRHLADVLDTLIEEELEKGAA